ncbi:MAG: hypothetical protein QNJ54_18785 [Prochloraceae cyanobacterium]|nr:hypothetical protein [Prochloraceae cyanobacterium]
MASKRLLDGLGYRQAQKRNSEKFNSFSKARQKEIRQKGYKNSGWDNVCYSWNILQTFIPSSLIDFVDFAVQKAEVKYEKAKQSQDMLEVLKAGKNVITTLKMKYQ